MERWLPVLHEDIAHAGTLVSAKPSIYNEKKLSKARVEYLLIHPRLPEFAENIIMVEYYKSAFKRPATEAGSW